MSGETLRLRPHHGLCIRFFEGKGYDADFTAHMAEIAGQLAENPTQEVLLVNREDTLCASCPNSRDASCIENGKAVRYDATVLALCGLTDQVRIGWEAYQKLLTKNILAPHRLFEVCGDCCWVKICHKKASLASGVFL